MTLNSEIQQASNTIDNIKEEVNNKVSFDTTQPLVEVVPLILSLDNSGNHNLLQEIITGTVQKIEDSNLIYIRPNCFRGCKLLESAKFSKLEKICRLAFCSCYKFNTLILSSTQVVALDSIDAFRYTPFEQGKGKIYVPDSLVQNYKDTENWNYYSDYIMSISTIN